MANGSKVSGNATITVADAVLEEVRRAVPVDFPRNFTLDSPLEEAGLDSLARMHVVNCLEEAFHVRFSEDSLYDIGTCRDLVDYIEARMAPDQREQRPAAPAPVQEPEGSTQREILPEHCDAAQFPECAAFQHRLASAAAAGLDNPFFRVRQRVDRTSVTIADREVVSYTSFDYLGLSRHPKVAAAAGMAIDRFGTSASASRLVGGNNEIVEQLDEAIARFLGTESAVALPSGYGTNASVLAHLFGPEDLILYDELAHNSIVQGVLLSRSHHRAFPHNDFEFLDALLRDIRRDHRRVVIAVEGAYSMDGDYPDLPRLIEVKREHKALLYVDEAHSVGVMGKTGRGICEHFGVSPEAGDLWMGTISKALGSGGGYLAGRKTLIEYLKYTTPAIVFATGLSPANAAAALTAVQLIQEEQERVQRLRTNSRLFLTLAQQAGFNTGSSGDTPIIPIILGDSLRCIQVSAALLRAGIDAQPILYPAVPENKARVRFFITAEHTEEQIRRTIQALTEIVPSNETTPR